jgi:hypothetical protein
MPHASIRPQTTAQIVHLDRAHYQWLRQWATQGELSVDEILYWVLNRAIRTGGAPWPPGWSPSSRPSRSAKATPQPITQENP